jgi:hypothetical protein
LAWIVFALAGAAGAPPVESAAAPITYSVRIIEAEGLGWREAVYSSLKPVTRQGSASVWTISHAGANRLETEVMKSSGAKLLNAPRVTSFSGVPATIFSRHSQKLVTQAAWNGGEAAPKGGKEAVRVGWQTTMVGRKLDQGVLVKIVLEDTAIRAIHQVNLRCDDAELYCQAPDGAKHDDVRKVAIEVPEIDHQEVLGEWLIPHGEFLLVSFGAHTVADKSGKAVVTERMAIVGADDVAEASAIKRPVTGVAAPSPGATAAPLPLPLHVEPNVKPVMPTPKLPSRSIPQGFHKDGTPAELPPLPADETEADSSASDSAEPLASPQTKKPQQPKPANDSAANKAALWPPKSATVFLPSLFLARPSVGFQFLLPLSPLSLRLPFNQKLEIEIYGRVVPQAENR